MKDNFIQKRLNDLVVNKKGGLLRKIRSFPERVNTQVSKFFLETRPHRKVVYSLLKPVMFFWVILTAFAFTFESNRVEYLTPIIHKVDQMLPETNLNEKPEENRKKVTNETARTAAPGGTFPLQRGMALVSRLSDPSTRAEKNSDPKGFVLGLYDIRKPYENGGVQIGDVLATVFPNWDAVTQSIFRHNQWINSNMGEVFSIEIDNSVRERPNVYVGSTAYFAGIYDDVVGIKGDRHNSGTLVHAYNSPNNGGDIYKLDGTTGNVSLVTGAIPSIGYKYQGGRGASAVKVPLNKTNGSIKSIQVVTGGTGYTHWMGGANGTNNITVSAPIGGGTTASGTATISNGVITGISLTSGGTGYDEGQTITISAPGGSGLTATVTLHYPLATSVIPTNQGSGYVRDALVTTTTAKLFGGDGTNPTLSTAVANVSASGSVTSYTITPYALGDYYTVPPLVTVNNRYTGVGGVALNYKQKILYTCSIDNGLIYAVNADNGSFIGSPYDHRAADGIADNASLAVTDARRLAIGMQWNKRDNRLYFGRIKASTYTVNGSNQYTYTTNEIVSVGLNADGSINTASTITHIMDVPASTKGVLNGSQMLGFISDIEFNRKGDMALISEMSGGSLPYRTTDSDFRTIKTAHASKVFKLNYTEGSSGARTSAEGWAMDRSYLIGAYPSVVDPTRTNAAGGTDFTYDAYSDAQIEDDGMVAVGDYLDGSGFNYGIQISPINNGNYPYAENGQSHYLVDDTYGFTVGQWAQKHNLMDVDVFSSRNLMISGNIYNDADALTDNTVDGVLIQKPSDVQLYANLFDANGVFIASVPVDTAGHYEFVDEIYENTNYVVTISSTQADASTNGLTDGTDLPDNWVNTGENTGTGAGNDGAVNGRQTVSVLVDDVEQVNFGIQHGPETAVNLQPVQPNPGGTVSVPVPSSAFSISNVTDPSTATTYPNTGDVAPGNVTGIIITGFPTNATSITIDGVVYTDLASIQTAYPNGIPTDASGVPSVPVLVDPVDGAVSVVIPIASIDNAGVVDATPGSITLPFEVPVKLSGTVFHDADALTDNSVDGTPIQSPSSTPLYANLFAEDGTFIASTPIDANGNYEFEVEKNKNYILTVSSTAATAGSTPATSVGLPDNWLNTGEHVGLGQGSDSTVDGILTASVGEVDRPEVNFGIQHGPETAVNLQPVQPNPGGAVSVPVPSSAFLISNVTDPSTSTTYPNTGDVAPGNVTGIVITGFPTNATSITIDGVVYTDLASIQTAYPNGIPTDSSGIPSVPVLVDPVDGAVSVVIPIASIDNAGAVDATPGSITLPFSETVIDPVPVKLSGTVFHDVEGLKGTPANTVDGTPIQSPSGTPLFANLFAEDGTFIASTPIDANGNYEFNVEKNTDYIVTISSTAATAGSTPATSVGLPANWVNTGEHVGLTQGSDGTVNGIITASVGEVDRPEVNFGIEQVPDSVDFERALAQKPTAGQLIPLDGVLAPELEGSDPEDYPNGGTLSGKTIAVTSLPTTGELWYNGVKIIYGDDGVNPVSESNPFTIAALDPSEISLVPTQAGSTSIEFTYAYVDVAGIADPEPATYKLTWLDPLPVNLVSFTGVKENATVVLNWVTSMEDNSSHFIVEQSLNARDWKVIGKVQAVGNSDKMNRYTAQHGSPSAGVNYYRLKMIDVDGSFEYSSIVSVSFMNTFLVKVFPNPASEYLKVDVTNWNNLRSVKLVDMNGRTHLTKTSNLKEGINVQNLIPGVYLVLVESQDGTVEYRRVVIGK